MFDLSDTAERNRVKIFKGAEYHAPSLVIFGNAVELTAAGSSGPNESGNDRYYNCPPPSWAWREWRRACQKDRL